MSDTDWAIIFATLAGPILAVQAQKLLERHREADNRRLQIFRTLMATRAASLSSPHVEALNSISLEFHGKKKSFKAVVDAWKIYLDHLSQTGVDAAWGQKRSDLFVELLYRMAPAVGYEFSKVEIAREIYSPKAHEDLEMQQQIIRREVTAILSGESALAIKLVDRDSADR